MSTVVNLLYNEHVVGIRYPEETKQKALELIRAGMTYTQIQESLTIPKSTLSVWANQAGKKRDRARQLAHLKIARAASLESIRRNKEARIALAVLTATKLARAVPVSKEEVGKSLLAMLYWAEGGKQDGNMKFTNTDPNLVELFITLLRAQYPIDEKRFRIALQLHSYHRQKDEMEFWSKKLRVPVVQFWKVYRKPRGGRKTYRRNSHGICNVHYASSAIQRELIALGHELALSISGRQTKENAATMD